MADKIALVVLAAGQGTRMKLDMPKPMVSLMGRPIIDYVLRTCFQFKSIYPATEINLVLGHQREKFDPYFEANWPQTAFTKCVQHQQLGTADAVKAYLSQGSSLKETKYVAILSGDVPLISVDHIQSLQKRLENDSLDGVVATFATNNPKGYGRIKKFNQGLKIIEEKDADEATKKISEVNSGLYIFRKDYLENCIKNISNKNKANEFYLTDTFDENRKVASVLFDEGEDLLGINNLEQLEVTTRRLNDKLVRFWMSQGVRFWDKQSVFMDPEVKFESGVVVYPNVIFEGKCEIGAGSSIGPFSHIKNTSIGKNVSIKGHTTLEKCKIHQEAEVGPYARLRPGADIGEKSKIGNFVEIKKSQLQKGVKVSHLSYVGDAEIGEETNIGCGFITCNYDGAQKHITKIGERCFVGSDSQTVAPVSIGNDCFVASGTTVNTDMPDGSFSISRGRQVTKEGMAN